MLNKGAGKAVEDGPKYLDPLDVSINKLDQLRLVLIYRGEGGHHQNVLITHLDMLYADAWYLEADLRSLLLFQQLIGR